MTEPASLGIAPTLRDPGAQARFAHDGVVVVPVLTPDEATALRTRVVAALPEDPGPFLDLFRSDPPPLRKRLDRLVRDELEDRVAPLFVDHDFWSAAVLVKPGGPPGRIGLHTDWTMVDESRFRSGLVWIALDDTTAENGALTVVPGTNRLDLPYRGYDMHFDHRREDRRAAIAERSVLMEVPAGHAAIWDNRLLHGSDPNHGTRWRIAVALGFKPRQAIARHHRRTADGTPIRYDVAIPFFLDYEPFAEIDRLEGEHVLDATPVAPPGDDLRADEIQALGPVPTSFEPLPVAAPSAAPAHPLPPTVPLRWIDLDIEDATDHPTAMADIAARRLDGLTVTGVFTADEAARAVERLDPDGPLTWPAMFGRMLGMSLANVPRVADGRSAYLEEAAQVRDVLRDAFGFDPFDRVADVMRSLNAGRPAMAPLEDGRSYLPGNIRWMEPGGLGLPAHVGNEFQVQSDGIGAQLRTTTRIRDHYSWFVLVQAPEEGGALSVYDLLEETFESERTWGELGRDDDSFDTAACRKVAPPAGTLVLFGGGWRWHRVDPIGGGRPRITYGGFAGPSLVGDGVNCWF